MFGSRRFGEIAVVVVAMCTSLLAALAIQSDTAFASNGDIRILTGLATGEATRACHFGGNRNVPPPLLPE